MRNVSLIGMPGSGKSTVGVLLAKALGYSFTDTDLLIQKQESALLQAILDRLGNDRFLDVEADVIGALTCDHTVIAPGGSVVYRKRGIQRLKALGPVVYLKMPYNSLEKRLGNLATRGVALAPGQTLRDLYDYRVPMYEKYADLTANADQPTAQDTVEAIVKALREY